MVAADIYEVVEEHFGEPASPDLVLKVREESNKTALDFGRRYHEWVITQKPRIAEKPARQLWPFIEGRYRGPKGVSVFAPAFSNDENQLWALYDGLVHHLLYCHSVAIENPLMHLITSSGRGRQGPFLTLQGGMLGFEANPTIIASRYIALLVALRDLVDCGAVVIVETGPSPMSGFAPQVPVYREAGPPGARVYGPDTPYALSAAQFAQVRRRVGIQLAERAEADLASQYGDGDISDTMREQRQEMLLLIALGQIVNTARISDRVGNLDIYLGSHFQKDALAEAIAVAPGWLTGSSLPLQRHMMLLDRLLQLDLPDLSNLGPSDIRAIRRSDETFSRWRQALGNGLGIIETLPDVPLTEEQLNLVREEIHENIMEAGLAVDTAVNMSDVKRAGRAGVLKLVVGSLVSGGTGVLAAGVQGGMTVGKELGVSAFGKLQQKPFADSIDRHTALFAPPSPQPT